MPTTHYQQCAKCDIWLRRQSIWQRSLWQAGGSQVWSGVARMQASTQSCQFVFLAFHAFANPPFCFSCFRHKWADGCKTGHLPAKLTSPLWLAQQMIETSIANQIRFLTDPGIWCPIFGSRCLPFF